jgi:enoyl-CoA hydratase/carnithine racemase
MSVYANARTDLVLLEENDEYNVITLNRPEKRNAMNEAAQAQLKTALLTSKGKKVVIITGVEKSFCAGVDIVELRERGGESRGRAYSQDLASWGEVHDIIKRHPAICIAAVNGFALGGGSTLVNNCELAVAAESAEIGTPEIGFGTWPGYAGPAMIKRLLPKHAAEIIFNAKRVDAATAFRMGLVNEVVPDDQLMTRAREIAEHICTFDGVLLDWAKRGYRTMLELSWDDAQAYSGHVGRGAAASGSAGSRDRVGAFAQGVRGSGQGANPQPS